MPQITITKHSESEQDDKRKNHLHTSIKEKRIILKKLLIKVEMLRVNIHIAKQEYMVRVGSLVVKDNQLDLEIIKYRNILHLMSEGADYEDAVRKIAKTYYAEQIELEKEKEEIDFEEKIFQKRNEQTQQQLLDIKKLWKKLLGKFHPDLVQDANEKKKREFLVKQINNAFQVGDIHTLLKIDKEHAVTKDTTIEHLEEILLTLMKEIEEQNDMFISLKKSEWYGWMIKIEKAKKYKKDVFENTEKKLLDDIVAKMDMIKLYKSQIQEMRGTDEEI
jgi:hypothetical protein